MNDVFNTMLEPEGRDPAFARAYAAESARIETIDAIINALDEARSTEKLSKAALARATDPLGEGARILKEWGGVLHQVDRTAEGFLWEGRTYPSLSKVAEVMTGVKRNGPRFFGLREGSTR